jgi:lysophospholipase L1-like esterase
VEKHFEKIKDKLLNQGKYWIAFVGDSITSTEWVHPNWREMVEYVLKDKFNSDWGIKTFNFGYDGSTTRDILKKIPEIIICKPNLIVLLIGANDGVLDVSIDEHKRNIIEIIKMVESSGCDLVLVTDNKPDNNKASEKYGEYVKVDRELGVTNFIDLYSESDLFPKERIYTFFMECDLPEENLKKGDRDFWHPNQLGNAYIAKVILEKVWGIKFDPEKYIETTNRGYKLPEY